MKSRVLILLVLVMVLAACDATATESLPVESAEPEVLATDTLEPANSPSTGLACLSGTWELVEIEEYMHSVVPPDLAGSMAFVESTGSASAEFGQDGTYTYNLDTFRVVYSMDIGAGPMVMEVIMQGEGNGLYEAIDDHTLTFTQLDDTGVTLTVTLAGEVFDMGMDEAISAFGSPDTIFEFDCDGDTLLTYPPIEGALPVQYARLP